MASEKGRWYDQSGRVVECDMREARKQLLFPSVTSITKSYRNMGLERYRDEQMILAGATTPYNDGEDDSGFTKRVLAAADEHRNEAAERGTLMHGEMAQVVMTGRVPPKREGDGLILPAQVSDWIVENLSCGDNPAFRHAELAMVNPVTGYAGTTDYWGMYRLQKTGEWVPAIVDFKTQGVAVYEYIERRTLKSGEEREYLRTRKSVNWYSGWWWQLGAYHEAAKHYIAAQQKGRAPALPQAWVSVAINTNENHPDYIGEDQPGMWVREWPAEKIMRGAAVVAALTYGWYLANDFPLPGSEERRQAQLNRAA